VGQLKGVWDALSIRCEGIRVVDFDANIIISTGWTHGDPVDPQAGPP
jgi:hypothetical protein